MSASASLLKGKKAKPAEVEAPTVAKKTKAAPAPAPVVEETAAEETEEVEVDVSTMNKEQLDALVVEHGITVPASWSKMSVKGKREWLETNLPSDDSEEATEEAEEAPFEADAPAPTAEDEDEPVAASEPVLPVVKGKAKKARKSKPVPADGPNPIADLVEEIENLKEADALAYAAELHDQTEFGWFKLGGVLSVIKKNAWYKKEFSTFKDYVHDRHGLKYRVADYYISIYDKMAENGVPWYKVSKLGWTQLKEIAGVITPENVDDWVDAAGKLTVIQLRDKVDAFLSGANPKALDNANFKKGKTLAFKVHDDQAKTIEAALEKAMAVGSTEVRTVALEYICLEYVNSKPKINMVTLLRNAGLEKVVEAMQKAFPKASLTVETEDEDEDTAEAA